MAATSPLEGQTDSPIMRMLACMVNEQQRTIMSIEHLGAQIWSNCDMQANNHANTVTRLAQLAHEVSVQSRCWRHMIIHPVPGQHRHGRNLWICGGS
jgi:hypothetical protein